MNPDKHQLPQLAGGVYLTDAGVGMDRRFTTTEQSQSAPKTATLPGTEAGCETLNSYYREFLELACETGTGFILDTPVWQPSSGSQPCGSAMDSINNAVEQAVNIVAGLRADYRSNEGPIVLNGPVGSLLKRHDLRQPVNTTEAVDYYSHRIRSLAEAGVDMITANSLNCSHEAIDIANAAKPVDIPLVISFAVKHDARLLSEETLLSAIDRVDAATDQQPVYYMVDCADTDHFLRAFSSDAGAKRVKGLRCSARIQAGDPRTQTITPVVDHATLIVDTYRDIANRMPWITVFGMCGATGLIQLHPIANMLCALRRHNAYEVYRYVNT